MLRFRCHEPLLLTHGVWNIGIQAISRSAERAVVMLIAHSQQHFNNAVDVIAADAAAALLLLSPTSQYKR